MNNNLGDIFTLFDKDLEPYSYVWMDTSGVIREKKICDT
jgi:hypothetical protein